MEWIKIDTDTRIPEGTRVLLREAYTHSIYYKAGTVSSYIVVIDDIESEESLTRFTHYAVISEPKD